MADKVRYNKIIDLLERGKPVFSTSTVPNGNLDDLTYIADADYDAVVIEMEHEGFSFSTLRTSLQVLLNRKRIAEKGNLQPDVVPLVRIPPNARERDQWVIKQALDTGVYGLVLPHLSTVADAQAAVAAARYPQVLGAQDFEPAGERGWGNRIASRYWGLTPQEYYDAADLWPLDPDGYLADRHRRRSRRGAEHTRHLASGEGHRRHLGRFRRHVGVDGIAGRGQPSGGARKCAARPGRLQGVRRPLCDGSHR
jgi:HpcH/HpaI aldolase/citrate lyase family